MNHHGQSSTAVDQLAITKALLNSLFEDPSDDEDTEQTVNQTHDETVDLNGVSGQQEALRQPLKLETIVDEAFGDENVPPEVVQQPETIQLCNKWPISTRSIRTVTKHSVSVSAEVSNKLSEVDNFHSDQFEWAKKFQPVNVFSLKTVKHLKRLDQNLKKSNRYRCKHNECLFTTHSSTVMASHVRCVHAQEKFACVKCIYETFNKNNLKLHMVRHSNAKKTRFYCDECSYQTLYQGQLEKHMKKHLEEDPNYQSASEGSEDERDWLSNIAENLQRQYNVITEQYPDIVQKDFMCHLCPFQASYFIHLRKHIMVQHPISTLDGEKLTCKLCPYETFYKNSLRIHHVNTHMKQPDLKKFVCGQCSFKTFSESFFNSHCMVFKHSENNPDESNSEGEDKGTNRVTNGLPSTSGNASRHPMPAQDLPSRGPQKQQYNEKQHRHAGQKIKRKILRCPHCPYQAFYLRHLENHIKSEHQTPARKKFMCERCPFTTFSQSSMGSHCIVYKHPAIIEVHRCFACPFVGCTRFDVKNHFILEHSKRIRVRKPFSCLQCPFRTCNRSSLQQHSIVFKHSKLAPSSEFFTDRFCCPQCSFESFHKGNLQKHMPTHSDTKPFRCNTCGHETKTKRNMHRHMETRHSEKRFQCTRCKRKFSRKSQLTRHVLRSLKSPCQPKQAKELGTDKYSCDKCSYETKRRGGLNAHKRIHLGERPYPCSLCGFKFREKGSLRQHMLRHNKGSLEKIYRCNECNRAFGIKSDLCAHKRGHKMRKTKAFSCTMCDFKSSYAHSLPKHVAFRHSDMRPFKCDVCAFATKTKRILQNHKKYVHEKNKRPKFNRLENPDAFKCEQCGYTCRSQFVLDIHVRTHTGEEPYSCDHCEFKCSAPASLSTHLRRHTDERPYACTQCDYKARQPMALENHMRTHTGERPFACNQCGYRATQKQSLVRHVYNMHLTEEEKLEKDKIKSNRKKKQIKLVLTKDEDNPETANAAAKKKRAKPWRNPVTSQSESKEKAGGDVKAVKKKKSKKSPVSEGVGAEVSTKSIAPGNKRKLSTSKQSVEPKRKKSGDSKRKKSVQGKKPKENDSPRWSLRKIKEEC